MQQVFRDREESFLNSRAGWKVCANYIFVKGKWLFCQKGNCYGEHLVSCKHLKFLLKTLTTKTFLVFRFFYANLKMLPKLRSKSIFFFFRKECSDQLYHSRMCYASTELFWRPWSCTAWLIHLSEPHASVAAGRRPQWTNGACCRQNTKTDNWKSFAVAALPILGSQKKEAANYM